ncbi:MAG: hypothetical protein Q4D29_05515 [Lachnospiraceae bacterium]|nr:hypothetical protein [Lachnospiraceae bacterium]
MKKDIIVYFVAENGFMNGDLTELFLSNFEEKGYSIKDVGMGSAYNMPIYLLGEIEDHKDEAVVVSMRFDGERPVPMVFFDDEEIESLVEGLNKADKNSDTFDIIVEVHKRIRG